MTRVRTSKVVLLAALAFVGTVGLSGCSAHTDPAAVSSKSTNASSDHASPSASASKASESNDDRTDGTTSLPDNFPKDDVPLLTNQIVFGADLGQGWIVYVSSDDFISDYKAAADKLVAGGYTKSQEVLSSQGDVSAFTNDHYKVILTAGTDSTYGVSVAYTVTKQ